ncbi:uncharacterized protein BX664DRAFT_341632 [Halteromyces radiatus]|uniref:uncharacterized protein n=1 Tax=Halteromyces radiatus TaxID=101107 RepID=UPI00221F74EF|nr:uncharacterized protein BX664DRAFT_341632 [Halteromyces radiatus]KAI8079860.1 hypothetical protein BX664DRAFT_341632 [Halteromyces radiatus]
MSSLLKLQESVLFKIIYYLNLQELQQLGQSCRQLHGLIYNNPRVWHQHVLFPAKDSRLTDKFIQQLVPQITRHYGIQTLRLIQLPLSWLGYLFIFDQFAHSVDQIQVETTHAVLQDLVYHLTVFAANLTVLQSDNHIPITFRQYCHDASYYYQVLVDHRFLGKSNVTDMIELFDTTGQTLVSKLDDPPFERLRQWQVVCTDHNDDDDDDNKKDCLTRLQCIVSFLAGRQVTNNLDPLVTIGQKRTQDQLEPSSRQRQRLVPPPRASSLYV